MAYPWASGAWAVGALASDSWLVAPSNAGVVWASTSWASNTWAAGTWQDAWARTATYSITGQNVGFLYSRNLTADNSTYLISAQDASLLRGYSLAANTATYTITGQDAGLVSQEYRITLVNTHNELVDKQTGVQIQGINLTGTTSSALQYATGAALKAGSWTPTAWASDVWATGLEDVTSVSLTSVSVVNDSLVTATMVDITSSVIPFTDTNHLLHRLAITKGGSTTYQYVEVNPETGYIVGTVQPADAYTTLGQSIFGGLTFNANQQVRLPVTIGGFVATWETQNGNITGRVTVAGTLSSPQVLSIPIWDDVLGWDVINTTIRDISDINTNLTASVAQYTITPQSVGSSRNYVLGAVHSSYVITPQDAGYTQGFVVFPAPLTIGTSLSNSFLAVNGMDINNVTGIGPNVIQVGSNFTINGAGFGNDTSLDLVLVDALQSVVECIIQGINNSQVIAKVPANAAALSLPVTLWVGDYSRDGNGNIILSGGLPVPISSRNVAWDLDVVVFASNNLTISSILEVPNLVQNHLLAVDGLTVGSVVDATTVGGGESSVTAEDVSQPLSLSEPVLTQHNILTVDGLSSSLSIDAPSITQSHKLTNNNLRIGNTLSVSSLTQHHILTVNGLNVVSILENNTLKQKHLLSVNSLTAGITLSEPTNVFKVFLNVNNLRCVITENNVTNTPTFTLSVNGLTCNTSLTPSLSTPLFSLQPNGLSISSSMEDTSLVQAYRVLSDNLICRMTFETPVLTPRFGVLNVNDITITNRLEKSRAKTYPDALSADKIKVYPVYSGEVLINQ